MKKIKYFSIVIAFLFLLFLSSCSNNAILAPSNISVDIEENLSWDSVENARTYQILITGKNSDYSQEVKVRKNNYSLSKLSEGDYEIKIKAISAKDEGLESTWSNTISFHKDFDPGLIYELINEDTEYQIISVGTAKGDLVIPSTYRGKPVVKIGTKAFRSNTRVTSVVMPNTIVEIGDSAFYNCSSLEKITLSENLKDIGVAAFQSCRLLTEIEIPSSVNTIPDNAFTYCYNLKKVILPTSVTTIGESSFSDCKALTDIDISNIINFSSYAFNACEALEEVSFNENVKLIPTHTFENCINLKNINFSNNNNIETISARAFSGCSSLKNVIIPEGVTLIDTNAFSNCTNLENITLPLTITDLDYTAFANTKVYNDQLGEDNQFIYIDKWLVSKNSKYTGENITKITVNTFKADTIGIASRVFYNSNLESVTLSPSIKYICSTSFAYNKSLWQFTTKDNGLVKIGKYALYGCDVLSQLNLKTGLEEIEEQAFMNCPLLNNSANLIPSTVKRIGAYAFYNTGIFSNPTDDGLVYAGSWIVGHKYTNSENEDDYLKIKDITIKDGTVGIADNTFFKCQALSSVVGSEKIKYIGQYAFAGCKSLSVLILNDNIKTIEKGTFANCESLININIPINLKTIDDLAFYDCKSLGSIDLRDTEVTTISRYAFAFTTVLYNVKFPDTLVSIGEKAFYKSGISNIELPNGLTSIGDYAFFSAGNHRNNDQSTIGALDGLINGESAKITIYDLVIPASVTYIGEGAFSKSVIKSITIPNGIDTINKKTFYNCTFLENVNLGNVVEIGEAAFARCTNLKYIHLPDSIKKIDMFAFRNSGLQVITLKNSIEEIGLHTFFGCNSLVIHILNDSINTNWDDYFNSNRRPMLLDVKYVDNSLRVDSFTYKLGYPNTFISNIYFVDLDNQYNAVGFKYVKNGEEITKTEITIDELMYLEDGTQIKVIWEKKE